MSKLTIASDTHERLTRIVRERLPWLILGLTIGTAASYAVSRFEDVLLSKISLAYFIPVIVYMSDAVGTQTETIFVRDLTDHRANFGKYLKKEFSIGLVLGLILGILMGIVALLWLKDADVALTVGLAMGLNVSLAPLVATIVPEFIFKRHEDPALGAGPFTTVIQDTISLLIYFAVASVILFR